MSVDLVYEDGLVVQSKLKRIIFSRRRGEGEAWMLFALCIRRLELVREKYNVSAID